MNYIDIIGTLAAICTTGSFIPQAYKIITTKDTKSISLLMYIIFVIGVFLWLLYGIFLMIYPIIIANSITLILTSTILYYKLKEVQKKYIISKNEIKT